MRQEHSLPVKILFQKSIFLLIYQRLKERAFTDLTSLGWIEMETSAGYYTEDGVLFSKDGTCLLAFPPARTGNYKVPSHVTEIADGAF